MRIISGRFKGKKLLLPKDKNTRPLKDLVKESIFNLLEHSKKMDVNLKNSTILDLFSGSGSFGVECLSRESRYVCFFENYSEAIKVLEKNLLLFKNEKKFQIFRDDCFEYFNSEKKIDKKFDIIFIDPPYKEIKINMLIEKIIFRKLLKKKGILIIHRHKKDKVVITEKIKILDIRTYGVSKVYFAN
tara:strand:- start:852 stop:1412 length:561 start_codon:yes stop_codon:yes gene_type:complete